MDDGGFDGESLAAVYGVGVFVASMAGFHAHRGRVDWDHGGLGDCENAEECWYLEEYTNRSCHFWPNFKFKVTCLPQILGTAS